MVDIGGFASPRYGAVLDVFASHFAAGQELGARFTLVEAGEIVVDLWAGHADLKQTRPFDERTLTQIFSTTKAIAALLVARLVDAGRLGYGQRVVEVWPEFGQSGKAAITVGQALSHQAGLAGLPGPFEPFEWFDWEKTCQRLEVMAPLWPPGSASGYHPVTFGFIAGEIFRRVDGRPMAEALLQDLARPFGLDLMIGIGPDERERCADVRRPRAMPDFGEVTEPVRLAFFKPWSTPAGGAPGEARAAPIPSTNGYATAEALARLMGALADGGRLDGRTVLSPATVAEASRERIRGRDLVLPYEIGWAAGFMRNAGLNIWGPGQETFGHAGWGGSCAFADPDRRLAGAYVMNRQDTALIGDARPRALIDAAYGSLA
jgi:CubicO group peptidase (beta-lactamase class C family)